MLARDFSPKVELVARIHKSDNFLSRYMDPMHESDARPERKVTGKKVAHRTYASWQRAQLWACNHVLARDFRPKVELVARMHKSDAQFSCDFLQ